MEFLQNKLSLGDLTMQDLIERLNECNQRIQNLQERL